jgi:hypothetical protein
VDITTGNNKSRREKQLWYKQLKGMKDIFTI